MGESFGFHTENKVLRPLLNLYLIMCSYHIALSFLHGYVLPKVDLWEYIGILIGLVLLVITVVFAVRKETRGTVLGELRSIYSQLRSPVLTIGIVWAIWSVLELLLQLFWNVPPIRYNIRAVFDFYVCLFLLYSCGFFSAKRSTDIYLRRVFEFMILVFTAVMVAGIIVVICRNGEKLIVPNYGVIYANASRIYIMQIPNTTAPICVCCFYLGLYLFMTETARWKKALWIFCMAVMMVIIVWSQRRGPEAALLISLAAFAAAVFVRRKKQNSRAKNRKIVLLILAGIILAAVCIAVVVKYAGLELRLQAAKSDSERLMLYTTILRGMCEDMRVFFLGVTPAWVSDWIHTLGMRRIYAHNQILQTWAGQGLPGLLCLLAILVLVAARCIRLMYLHPEEMSLEKCIFPAILLSIVVDNMTEAKMIMYHHPSSVLFFLLAGYVMGIPVKKAGKGDDYAAPCVSDSDA